MVELDAELALMNSEESNSATDLFVIFQHIMSRTHENHSTWWQNFSNFISLVVSRRKERVKQWIESHFGSSPLPTEVEYMYTTNLTLFVTGWSIL